MIKYVYILSWHENQKKERCGLSPSPAACRVPSSYFVKCVTNTSSCLMCNRGVARSSRTLVGRNSQIKMREERYFPRFQLELGRGKKNGHVKKLIGIWKRFVGILSPFQFNFSLLSDNLLGAYETSCKLLHLAWVISENRERIEKGILQHSTNEKNASTAQLLRSQSSAREMSVSSSSSGSREATSCKKQHGLK